MPLWNDERRHGSEASKESFAIEPAFVLGVPGRAQKAEQEPLAKPETQQP